MQIHDGMPVINILNFLREQYGISVIGKIKAKVGRSSGQAPAVSSKKRRTRPVEINGQMKISELQWMLSENLKSPAILNSDAIMSIPPNWNLTQFVKRSNLLCDGKARDKKQLLLSLITCADTFADVDWIIRIAKKSRVTYLDNDEKMALFHAIQNSLDFFSEDQKIKFFDSLVQMPSQ